MTAHCPFTFSLPHLNLAQVDIEQRQKNLSAYLGSIDIDLLMVSAQDSFLSEYTPQCNNHRVALSGFTGSVGDGIFFAARWQKQLELPAPFVLAVDGRYHLQVGREIHPHLVQALLLNLQTDLEHALFGFLLKAIAVFADSRTLHKKFRIGFDAPRTSFKRLENLQALLAEHSLQEIAELAPLPPESLSRTLEIPGWKCHHPIASVKAAPTGRSIAHTHTQVLNIVARQLGFRSASEISDASVCVITCSTDDAAFLLNARAFHNPQQAGIMAYTFLLHDKIILFLPEESAQSPLSLTGNELPIIVVRQNEDQLKTLLKENTITEVFFNSPQMNGFLPALAKECWSGARFHQSFSAIDSLRASKTPEELAIFRDINLRSSRAIARTLRWAKDSCMAASMSISELDLSHKISEEYQKEGAVTLSFRSIAGTGPNSAIIHYGTPSAKETLLPGEITLLDSGAYYESGFATDCTRVFYNGDARVTPPAPWQRQIYTQTLKSFVTGMTLQFFTFEQGRALDACVRKSMQAHGFDYAHGTGHGVGINVHEAGIRLSPVSPYTMPLNACVSMEPGIYLAGKGGVRIENVVRVELQDVSTGLCGFENFIWVGFDWDLVDTSLLTAQEKSWLLSYEAKCQELGTQITACPL